MAYDEPAKCRQVGCLHEWMALKLGERLDSKTLYTVVPVMNGHPRDQANVSVQCRWPLIGGTDGHV